MWERKATRVIVSYVVYLKPNFFSFLESAGRICLHGNEKKENPFF